MLPTCQSPLLGLLFSLFVWLPFFPGDPPPGRPSMLSAEGAPGAPEQDRVGLCCCGSCLCCSHTSPAWKPPQSPAQLCPQAFPEPTAPTGLPFPPFLLLIHSEHKGLWQGTRQAPGKTVVQGLLGAFRGLRPLFPSFANGKAGWRAQHSQPALLQRQKLSILGVVVLIPLCSSPLYSYLGRKEGSWVGKCGGEKQLWLEPP